MDTSKSVKAFRNGSRAGGLNTPSQPGSATSTRTKTVFDTLDEIDEPGWKKTAVHLIDGTYGSTFMTIITIWALFGDDVRLMATYKEDDDIFLVLTIICLIAFSSELFIASVAKKNYFLGFYFFLDVVATLSLLPDIPAVYEGVSGIKEPNSQEDTASSSSSNSGVADNTDIARAGRSSRAGTRAGRIVRLVRLVRILKLYKQAVAKRNGEEVVKDEEEEHPESRVGKKLSEMTTRRVIIGVLMMLFFLQLFDVTTYQTYVTYKQAGLNIAVSTYSNSTEEQFYGALDAFVEGTSGMYWIKINNTDYSDHYNLSGISYRQLRGVEFLEFEVSHEDLGASFVKFDIRSKSQLQAMLNVFQTIFICLILGCGSMLFSRDANVLVLAPLEAMFNKVRAVADNPLSVVHRSSGHRRNSESAKSEAIRAAKEAAEHLKGDQFETKFLDKTFTKMCQLMVVGFGDAGAEIIAENLGKGGDLDPMIPGKKMVAIFGFCDIRCFTDATEILQEGVMEFVNSIAQIVHMEVALHGGSANKNIGDAFLLVWKFPSCVTMEDIEECVAAGKPVGENANAISSVADKALATFVVVIAMMKKSKRTRSYSLNPKLCARMPNYAVKMGFGLHVGWAIEGAIGSTYKVDASYLSPNVNMAARLEAATKQFGTPILLSGDFFNILSPKVRARCRAIDKVTVKGSTQPMVLATYDTDDENLVLDFEDPIYSMDPIQFSDSTQEYSDEFNEHPDIVQISAADELFLQRFGQAYEAYISGNWPAAQEILKTCEKARKTVKGNVIVDGPTQTLLAVMAEHKFVAPATWQGFRELTEK